MPRLFRLHALESLVILVVLSAAVWLIPQFGSQHDEILFIKPVFDSKMSHATLEVFHKPLPLMMMSYLGALKVYLYKVILGIFPASLWSLRLPALLTLFGATLLIRGALRRIGMPVAATAFLILFLTSPVIIVTGVFDWGPVCLQLLLFSGIVYFLARASIDHGLKWFGLAGLFFGLGVWDKLTFLLCFAPVTLVLLEAALRKLPRTRITKALSLVLLTAVLGSLPFLLALSQDRTHSTSQLQVEVEKLSLKAGTFARSMTGTVLTGYFTSRDAYVDTIPDAAWAYFARVTDRILQLSDYDRWIVLALLLIAVGIPGKTQPGRLLLMLSFALSWLTMAMFRNLGGSGHHTVLLHPVLLLIVALAIEDCWHRPALRYTAVFVAATLVMVNLAALGDFLLRVKYLPIPTVWSPAISKAAIFVTATGNKNVFVDDWGLENSVVLFSKGKIWAQSAVPENWREGVSDSDRANAVKAVTEPGAIFMGFAAGQQQFPKGTKLLAEAAQAKGLERIVVEEYNNVLGKPVVVIYRFQPK